jgi:hypothetical protein
MTNSTTSAKTDAANGCHDPALFEAKASETSFGVGLAVLIAGGTAGTALGLLGGPVAAIAGTVVGAVVGGVGGQAIADLVESVKRGSRTHDAYTTRAHCRSTHAHDNLTAESIDAKQAPREAWSHLDETSKDLIRGLQSSEPNEP